MLEMCSGIYLLFAVIMVLLFRVTLLEARHENENKGHSS